MSNKLPITILTGFLGAGKTTMLQSLLGQDKQSNYAVVINEFGMISVDGTSLKMRQRTGVEIFELSRVLIAYSSDEHFASTLHSIALKRHKLDHVLIETSGLAVPTAIMEILERPEFKRDFVVDAIISVVDTPYFLSNAKSMIDSERSVFRQQLNCADIVVLNKIDQLDERELSTAELTIRQQAPAVRFVELARNACLNRNIALGLRLNQPARWLEVGVPAAVGAGNRSAGGHVVGDGHSHSGLAAHQHGILTHQHIHSHDPAWVSFVLHSHQVQDIDSLAAALKEITSNEPVLRLKGNAICSERANPVSVQGVRTRVLIGEIEESSLENHHDAAHQDNRRHHHSELVFIGHNLERAIVADILSRRSKTLWS